MNLVGRGISIDLLCPLCLSYQETSLHFFKHCSHTFRLWETIPGLPTVCANEDFVAGFLRLLKGRMRGSFVIVWRFVGLYGIAGMWYME